MVDAAELREQYRVAVTSCLGITAIPFLLAFVAYMMSRSPDSVSAQPAPAEPLVLLVFGLLALSPLVSVPLVRRVFKTFIVAQSQSTPGIERNVAMWAITEYALWELSSLFGFVGFVIGGPVVFLLACMGITFMGYALSFPRWSSWVALLQELGLVRDPNALAMG